MTRTDIGVHRSESSSASRRTVGDAAVTVVKALGPGATIADVEAFFEDDHVHLAVVVEGRRVLTAIERADLSGAGRPDQPARDIGTLVGRCAHADDDLARTSLRMIGQARRRLVVLDDEGRLLGLLCLKRHRRGFCSDEDVLARASDRR